ncbi:MAG: gluconate 2-dehydrogenase subunit 3 family protein [Bryobacteraceae bacterium]
MSEERYDELSRREILRNIGLGLTLTAGGADLLSAQAAQHVHQAVAEQKKSGPYKPKCFTAHEYRTLQKLADLIVPADEKSKGAIEAGAPEFIDLLASNNADLAAIFTGGLAWMDREMERRHKANFVSATPEQQTALLDAIAYRKNDAPEIAPGIRFFAWARNMTVDAFYTSRTGVDDLGYKGNGSMSEFSVPEEAIQYALRRSNLA